MLYLNCNDELIGKILFKVRTRVSLLTMELQNNGKQEIIGREKTKKIEEHQNLEENP